MKIFTELSCLNASSASLKGESTDGKICSRVVKSLFWPFTDLDIFFTLFQFKRTF